jgi:hypothetical protein
VVETDNIASIGIDARDVGALPLVAEGTIALPLKLTGLDPVRHIL